MGFRLEFFPWVLSFFALSFFPNVQKKPDLRYLLYQSRKNVIFFYDNNILTWTRKIFKMVVAGPEPDKAVRNTTQMLNHGHISIDKRIMWWISSHSPRNDCYWFASLHTVMGRWPLPFNIKIRNCWTEGYLLHTNKHPDLSMRSKIIIIVIIING